MTKIKTFLICINILIFLIVPIRSFSASQEKESAKNEQEIFFIIQNKKESLPEEELTKWIKLKPYLTYSSNYNSEIENIDYCPFGIITCSLTKTRREKYQIKKELQTEIRDDEIKAFLEDLARKINRKPINAEFRVKNGKVETFKLSKEGLQLEVEANTKKIARFIKKKIKKESSQKILELSYQTLKPEIRSSDADKLGIKTLIGEGSSNFSGSPKNRIHNIQVAVSRFEGKMLAPGEEFSFVDILGPVDGEHGYLPELVIKNNKTEAEFGGGICQVSTTIFRAAIYSGLEITARKNHAYPVQYYNPQGMDATIYIPRPDLRFINNTPGHLLIQAEIKDTKLIFKFYGTDDKRNIIVKGPFVTERNSDGSMKTYFTQKVTKNKKTIIDDIFRSSYDSPNKYPHPEDNLHTSKPDNWSDREWKEYKEKHDL